MNRSAPDGPGQTGDGPGGPLARPAAGPGTAVVGLGEEPDMLVQDFSLRHASWAVLNPLMLKLVRYDDAWRPWPELAERIPSVDNGDRRTLDDGRVEVRWRLRRGIRWHDGAPVTAHDALFTHELLTATPPPYPHHTVIAAISEMFVPRGDDHTLVVRYRADEPFAPYEEWGTVLPRHLLADAGLHDAGVREGHPFLRAPVFHGPFRFAEWKQGDRITLTAAGPHPAGSPHLQRIEFRFYPGPAELRAAALAGDVDVTDLTGFDTDDAAALDAAGDALSVHRTPSLTWEHIDINLDGPVLGRREVRHALAHGIDRREIADGPHGGRHPIADSWLPPRHPAAADVVRYPYDPDRAEALLDKAGLRRGSDGLRVGPDGQPLELDLLTTRPASPGGRWTASATRAEAARIVAAQLRRVGVRVRVRALPSDEAFPLIRRRRFPHLAMFAWSMGLETTGYLMWHSSKVPNDDEWYGINVSGWRCEENDRLLDALIEEHRLERRYELMRRQQRLWAEELPSLPLYFPVSVTTAKRRLRGIRPVGVFGCYATWNSWEWHWAADAEAM
ncbi:peptide ABC transporter substrate-binding protein [Nocardiopsis rhodophaea]|uniref:peptide ABC transporter substrate-binding protein n=1 Tax=Nocardiopsis rhodophaea TaxID=280238 RepID=UPI0031D676E6